MSADEEDYGNIADEDFIEAFSQASQVLPPHPRPQRASRDVTESDGSGDEEGNGKSKKKKYKIHEGVDEVPKAIILGATQAECLNPDSSPYRIRGPIYKKPRPELPEPPKAPISSAASRVTPQPKALQSKPPARRISGLSHDDGIAQELDDLPSDAFSSPSPPHGSLSSSLPPQRLVASQTGFRQTTLFGGRAPAELPASQVNKRHNFIKDTPPELPTHHVLDPEALKTWVYPTNLGAIREYQYGIVRNGLFNNLLVALPTGLGKTFIAATIMLNYYRWTKNAQIIFVAPTKPLVAQQVDACFKIAGIPRSETTMLTGEQATDLRAEEWLQRRVFFMTPQTLVNDLSTGIADPKKIVLLVVDEAHRATGNYAYVKVVEFMRRFNKSFRVLALTATPGSDVEKVQEVIDNLEISKVEIRTEESIDIQQYVHRRKIDQVLLDPSDEIIMVKGLFARALQPLVNQLCSQNAYWNKDPMSLNSFSILQARKNWFQSPTGRQANMGLKGMMNSLFTVLASVAHGIKLLNFHGIGPFYSTIKEFRQGVENGKGGKYRKQIIESPDFRKMMERIQFWLSKDDFVGHPKLTYLCDTVLNHFLDAGEGRLPDGAPPSNTRVIVFSEYRDSAEDITRILNQHGPMIRASVFVGQADSKRSEGMNQARQQETIRKFQSGIFNVLVATSIGEEGLDIGQVDLIVCYDASGSPIRMLQRMGRTGRKRAGNIVLLLMRGKEEESFAKAKDNYEQMQKMISSGERFAFRHDLSVRIVPKDAKPEVDKRIIDIPFENTQDQSLPEPKRRSAKAKKKPSKKFHMPDGVEIGFQKASRVKKEGIDLTDFGITMAPKIVKAGEETQLTSIPSLQSVLLSPVDTVELQRRYQNIPGLDFEEVEMPNMNSQTLAQRSLLPTANIPHGYFTKKCVRLFQTLASSQRREDRYVKPFGDEAPPRSWSVPPLVEDERNSFERPAPKKKAAPLKRKPAAKPILAVSDVETDSEVDIPAPAHHEETRAPVPAFYEDESDDQRNVPAKRKQKRKRATLRSSEGEGDDLANSEAPSEDSDDGESLKDFLAEDEEEITTATLSSSQTISSPVIQQTPRPLYKPSPLTVTQDTAEDDDLPDIGELIGRKTKPTSMTMEDSDDNEDSAVAGHRGKRRRVIVDDSDE